MGIEEDLDNCLTSAYSTFRSAGFDSADDRGGRNQRLRWHKSQLSTIIKELEELLESLQSGNAVGSGVEEDLIEMFEIEIYALRGQIQSLSIGR
jgi:hypothetical protein